MVKTNKKGFCKEAIDNITKDWMGGSYLVMRSNPIVPGFNALIYIGYKYNVQKVLSFIVTDYASSTKAYITYLSKYPDQCSNVPILPVALSFVVSKVFGSVVVVRGNSWECTHD